jgi:glycine cleavage system H protein
MNDANDEIRLTIDKFIFRFPKALRYSDAGIWVRREDRLLRLGLSDFIQQRSGDVAFATPAPEGTSLDAGDEIASIETVKVNLSLPSPIQGKIVEINPSLRESPEFINEDPYGVGWIAVVKPENPERDLRMLLTAEEYANLARQQASTGESDEI